MPGRSKKLVMCQACRGLIAASLRVCPLCGRESVPPLRVRLGDRAESSRFFTLLILSINVALFAMMAAVEFHSGAQAGSFLNGASDPVLYDFGGRLPAAITSGQWWRLVTPIFLHIGVVHLMFNSFALFQIGPIVEETYGSQKFIFLYLAAGIVGNIGSYLFNIRGAGASGAIFGLIGLTAVYGYRMGGSMGQGLMRQMLIWAGIGLVMGGVIGADNVNHIGGLITGAVLGFVIKPEQPTIAREATLWNGIAIGGAVLITVSFVIVGLNYGKVQRNNEVLRLDDRMRNLERAFEDSLRWRTPADGDSQKLVGQVRSAISDVERVPKIDDTSDALRRRLIELAKNRASVIEDAAKRDAALPSDQQARADYEEVFQNYQAWVRSVASQYNLVV